MIRERWETINAGNRWRRCVCFFVVLDVLDSTKRRNEGCGLVLFWSYVMARYNITSVAKSPERVFGVASLFTCGFRVVLTACVFACACVCVCVHL
jgi:hypothetical protein